MSEARAVNLAYLQDEVDPILLGIIAQLVKTKPRGSRAIREAIIEAATTKPRVMFVLGGPGAGKGTACAKLVADGGWAHLSAGDCLRAERKRPGSKNGELINRYIADGKIVPVEITIALLLDEMKRLGELGTDKFLIDGFPRNLDNYDGWFSQAGPTTECLGCVFMECPLEILTKRIMGRAEEAKAAGQEVRKDDNMESLLKRFDTYKNESLPIVEKFRAQGLAYELAATGGKQEVYAQFKSHIDAAVGSGN
jgi:UMP-CMP kinase